MTVYAPTYCPGTACDPCAGVVQVGGIASCHFTGGPTGSPWEGTDVGTSIQAIVSWTDATGSHTIHVNQNTSGTFTTYIAGGSFTIDFGWSVAAGAPLSASIGANVAIAFPGEPGGFVTAVYDTGLSMRIAPSRVRAVGRSI